MGYHYSAVYQPDVPANSALLKVDRPERVIVAAQSEHWTLNSNRTLPRKMLPVLQLNSV
jgi:hypothetical protein